MNTARVLSLLLFSGFVCSTHATDTAYSVKDVNALVPKQASDGWKHSQFSSMPENNYLSAFNSKEHAGKLNWNNRDLQEGKIEVIQAMKLAKQWTEQNTPFGESQWEIESVTYHFRSGDNEIEYICAVTLKTSTYKMIEVIVLPNNEVLPPKIDPEL